jgi:hypothetical protein
MEHVEDSEERTMERCSENAGQRNRDNLASIMHSFKDKKP